jgi:serine/threonine-protein kinase
MFCAFCGSRQPIAQQGVHAVPAPAVKQSVTAKLLIEGTTELPMPAFALQKEENLLGRRDPMSNIFPEVDLSKFDPQTKISRRHARIWKQGSNFLVEDLGSSNGTILSAVNANTVRLTPHKPQMLTSGDKIKLGDTTLHFVID